jgi:hypothetical protein
MRDLPPPLPPDRRTVGQLIAESIRFYGSDFWRVLPLGLPLALVDQASVHKAIGVQMGLYWLATPLFVAAYLWACRLVLDAQPNRVAVVLAVLIWLPFPALRAFFVLPAIAWLAFIGLAVPAAMLNPALGAGTLSYAAGSSAPPTTRTRSARWRRWSWWSASPTSR